MKVKTKALLLILIIYVFADIFLIASVMLLKDAIKSPILVMFIADIVATLFVYLTSLVFKNASVYDPYWSVVPVFIIITYYIFYDVTFYAYHLIVLIPFLIWAIRLTLNWVIGFEDLNWEDFRYKGFKEKYPKLYQFISLIGIMLIPTCLVFLGTIPLWFLISSDSFSFTFIIGGAIILFAVIYQAISDYQMKKFKNEENAKSCIDTGLWRYSRHPNYFGEICIWWGCAISAIGVYGIASDLSLSVWLYFILAFAGAVFITLLFIFISIPMMEKHIIITKDGYLDYKKKVKSPLFPICRKKDN